MKKRTTRIFSFAGKKCLPVTLFTLALASADAAFAQESNPWVGEALPAESGDYYLYNTKGGGFLLGANSWGTQASLGQPGLLCTVTLENGKYKIVTQAGGENWGLGSNGYVDNKTPAAFTFTDLTPEDGKSEFVISLEQSYLYWAGNGTVVNLNADGGNETQWMLVSRAQREKMLDNATPENGVDATFYILGAGFDRVQPSGWAETHDGGSLNLFGANAGGAGGTLYCVYASGNNSFDVYQELTGIRNGRYRLSCSGFYTATGEARNAMLYAGTNESPLLAGVDDGQGLPANNAEAVTAFADGRYTGNAVEAIVLNGKLRIGVKKSVAVAGDVAAFDDFRLTYLGTVDITEAVADARASLQNMQQLFADNGATAIASELKAVYDQYAGAEANEATLNALSEAITSAGEVRASVASLAAAIKTTADYLADAAGGKFTLCEAARTAVQTQIDAAKTVLAEKTMAEIAAAAETGVADLNTALNGAKSWVALSYPLTVVKALADRIGGLDATEVYKKVMADLNAGELTYDDMTLDVNALNFLCKDKMDEKFLAAVTEENPLDLTSFIVNPNIYQNGETAQMPGGWTLIRNDARDNKNFTSEAHADTQLYAGNWSGSKGNDVTGIHYGQMIGGDAEGALQLPDGLYKLEAATYSNGNDKKIVLYATSDSVNINTTFFNLDNALYTVAREQMGTTTTVTDIVVTGGRLYIGVRGADPENNHQGGNGKAWYADNFRLTYVGTDALEAYRERLRTKLADGATLHETLMKYGIDDSEDLGLALDEEEGYHTYLEEGTAADVLMAVDDMEKLNADAKTVIAHYEALNPLVVNGSALGGQLADGSLFAQPTVKKAFVEELEKAAELAEAMTWKNYLSDKIATEADALKTATTNLLNSAALCYPMGTAKILADQIGGLDNSDAYTEVVRLLASDVLDQLDVDLAVQALQAACVDAMTPEVLARATVEKPFNMTTFIVNPNIYQNVTDDNGNPVDNKTNGWICETHADGTGRVGANAGDTWLWCYSWSGHSTINVAAGTNYRQRVGTQIAEEGLCALPSGAYRVEAATYVDVHAELLELYALVQDVEATIVTGSEGQDSTVYVYTDVESMGSALNGDKDAWDKAQSVLGTTTVIPEMFVDKGAVTIGIRGTGGVIGGNGHHMSADNFRLYYVGVSKGDNIADVVAEEPEKVDVYDITGKLVRRQVKRADAVKGLKKGIYIAGGKKYVVAGR